ncbi:hypothetical protein IIC45_01420, partial [Patescibacteria group bacterium]|nr:hypothetical protein [Patescibacteria group bacterium]
MDILPVFVEKFLKMVKKKWEIKSKNYFARIKIKKTKKDGEYYDIVFGLKGHKNREMHAHYGIKVVAENGIIGGKVFFVESRKATSSHRQETFNSKTGELISKEETIFNDLKAGAEIHYATIYHEKEKKAFLT